MNKAFTIAFIILWKNTTVLKQTFFRPI